MLFVVIKFGFLRVLECLGLTGVVAVESGNDVAGTVAAVDGFAVNFISFWLVTRLGDSFHQFIFCPSNSVLSVVGFSELTLVLGGGSSDFDCNFIYLLMVFIVNYWFRIRIRIPGPTLKDFSNSWLHDAFDSVVDVVVCLGRPTIQGLGLPHFLMRFDKRSGSYSFKIFLFLLEFFVFILFLFLEVSLLLFVVKAWHFLI